MGNRSLAVVACTLCITCTLLAQDLSSSLWLFGNQASIDFRRTPPLVGLQTGFSAFEGSATVCDSVTGALLFFTDGQRIFDRNGTLASTDANIRNFSSTQGALVIRIPNSGNRFVVLSVEDETSALARALARDVIFNANGSLTVGPTRVIDGLVTEKLTAVRQCNGRDYWVIYKLKDGRIRAMPLNETGLVSAAPVTSIAALLPLVTPNQIRGEMKVSPDGRWLAAVNESLGTELYRFNNATGQVSSGVTFDLGTMQYGVCFSADSKLLYTNNGWAALEGNQPSRIFQFDLSAANIAASKVIVGTLPAGTQPGHMQIAPDGRLYIALVSQPAVSFVANPNLLGAACGYTHAGLALAAGSNCIYGLANFPQDVFIPRFTRADTSVCIGNQLTLGLASKPGFTYLWSPPTGLSDATLANPVVTVTQTQTYTVQATDDRGCIVGQDVTIIAKPLPTITGLLDTAICPGADATLTAVVPAGSVVQWSPPTGLSSTTNASTIAQPTATTTYTLTVTGPNTCVNTQSVVITVRTVVPPRLSANGTIDVCRGQNTRIGTGLNTGLFLWSDGSTDSVLVTFRAGGYRVVHTDLNGCVGTDSVTVRELTPPSVTTSADTTICANGTATLRVSGAINYRWTGSGLSTTIGPTVTATPTANTTYTVVGTDVNGCSDTTSVNVVVRTPISSGVGFADTTICPCDSVAVAVPSALITFTWDDGSAARTRTLRGSQTRTISGTDVNGCAVTPISFRIDTVISTEIQSASISKSIARDGETIKLDVAVTPLQGSPSCLGNSAVAIIQLRSSILAPSNATSRGTIDATGNRTVQVPLVLSNGTYRAQLTYISTLGVDDSTSINITGIFGSNGCTVAGVDSAATFALDEICKAGNVARRFVSPNNAASILAIMPNPVQDNATVRIETTVATSWTIHIEDILGRPIKTVAQGSVSSVASTQDIPIDVRGLPSGRYLLVLESATNRTACLMEVIR